MKTKGVQATSERLTLFGTGATSHVSWHHADDVSLENPRKIKSFPIRLVADACLLRFLIEGRELCTDFSDCSTH